MPSLQARAFFGGGGEDPALSTRTGQEGTAAISCGAEARDQEPVPRDRNSDHLLEHPPMQGRSWTVHPDWLCTRSGKGHTSPAERCVEISTLMGKHTTRLDQGRSHSHESREGPSWVGEQEVPVKRDLGPAHRHISSASGALPFCLIHGIPCPSYLLPPILKAL